MWEKLLLALIMANERRICPPTTSPKPAVVRELREISGTSLGLTECYQAAEMLELAPLRRKVRLLQDVLGDPNRVCDVVLNAIVEQVR